MQLLTPTPPRVLPGRTIDILNVAQNRGMSRGFARIDLTDPVFFDHPLDHVPGMLPAVAVLELAEHDSMLDPDNITLRLTFTRFCELDAPVLVAATREVGGTYRIDVTQSGRDVVTGSLGRRETSWLTERVAIPPLADGPICSELVHRADPGNVAIGLLTVHGRRVWARVRDRDAIDGLPPRASAVASILEAARQLVTAILHIWGRQPFGIRMIFVGFTAELPTAVPVGGSRPAVSWQITPPEQTRKLLIDVHWVDDHAVKVGSILIAARCVDGDEYARLRAR
ncbi:hypothetical protein [Mycolicibacterium phlei]